MNRLELPRETYSFKPVEQTGKQYVEGVGGQKFRVLDLPWEWRDRPVTAMYPTFEVQVDKDLGKTPTEINSEYLWNDYWKGVREKYLDLSVSFAELFIGLNNLNDDVIKLSKDDKIDRGLIADMLDRLHHLIDNIGDVYTNRSEDLASLMAMVAENKMDGINISLRPS